MIIEDIQEALSALGIDNSKYILRIKNEVKDEATFKEAYSVITDIVDDICIENKDGSVAIPVTWDQVVAKDAELKAKFGYINQRQQNYPSITDQLDTMYHKGFDAWKAEIKAIKDKYPKPE
tara:strand:+ start:589 stop:951 length:363 start_codon:yes stop_codon:yes gene_type:complete